MFSYLIQKIKINLVSLNYTIKNISK